MGWEHDISKYDCGCKKHHTYREVCGMGPIEGTSKEWWEYCPLHTLARQEATNGPYNRAQGEFERILDDIYGWKDRGYAPLDRERLQRILDKRKN